MSGSRASNPAPAPPANGPTPRPASTAICSTSSPATAISTALARSWTKRAPSSPCRGRPSRPGLSRRSEGKADLRRPPAACCARARPKPTGFSARKRGEGGAPEPAARLFRAGRPVPGTPAEACLRARRITGRLDWPALRYHPSVYHRAAEDAPLEVWPALLAAVTDLDGDITGILRTWLDRSRPAKAPLGDPRRALGAPLGSGVRFGKPSDILAAGEGVETMLALKSVLPLLPMVAGLSANHLASPELPPARCRLYV